MSNDEDKVDLTQRELQERVALLKSLNSGEKYIARSFTPSSNNLSSISQDRDSFLRSSQNRELATKNDIYYAFTTSSPRLPNQVEKLFLELQYGTSENYKYVSIYANGSLTDALPLLDNVDPDNKATQIILNNIMIEAVYNTSISPVDIKKGSIVAIQFLDKKNNKEPIIIEIPDMKGVATIPGASSASTPFGTRSLFTSGGASYYSVNLPGNITEAAKKVGSIIYNNMKGRKGNKACEFLATWEKKYDEKYKSARTKYATNRYTKVVSEAVRIASERYSLEEDMLRTFAWIESGYQPYIVNDSSGATGLLQILPYLTIDGKSGKGGRKIYNILYRDLADPLKNATAVAERLRSVIDKLESQSYPILKIKKLQPWQIYVMHNQGPDGLAVQLTACRMFNDKPEREELILAAQHLFDRGYGPIKTGGRDYFPKRNIKTG